MQPFLLNCLVPLVSLFAVGMVVVVSMHRWPNLWPPSFLDLGMRVETWVLVHYERVRLWLWPEPEAPLDAAQRRLRASRGMYDRWAAVPFNRLTLVVTLAAAAAFLISIVGLVQPTGSAWRSLSGPLLAVTVAVYLLDLLYRHRVRMLEKERVVASLGSRSNAVALDAARVATARDWHRDGSLAGSAFEHANLSGLVMARAKFRGVSFMYASLDGADLMFADLANARLGSSDLRDANLNFCNLENAALGLADLGNASLGRCSLRNAHMEGANLRDTFLDQADLDGAYLEQAIYNSKTHWPKGFTPPVSAVNWDTLNDTERDWFRQWRWYVH